MDRIPKASAARVLPWPQCCYDSSRAAFVATFPMVRVRLKTKLVLAISSMVFVLVALFCYIFVSHRVRETIAAAKERADFIAN